MNTIVAGIWKPLLGLLAVVFLLLAFAGPSGTAPEPAPAAAKPREPVRRTTQRVLDVAEARRQGGVPATAREPGAGLDVYSKAYRDSVGQVDTMAVEQRVKLHEAEHGAAPRTHEEFMRTIIAAGTPDAIHLPMLPFHQEYAYDPVARKLVVMEFPQRKEERHRETTEPEGP